MAASLAAAWACLQIGLQERSHMSLISCKRSMVEDQRRRLGCTGHTCVEHHELQTNVQ